MATSYTYVHVQHLYATNYIPRLIRTCRSSAELMKPVPSLSNTLSPSMKSSIEPCSFF